MVPSFYAFYLHNQSLSVYCCLLSVCTLHSAHYLIELILKFANCNRLFPVFTLTHTLGTFTNWFAKFVFRFSCNEWQMQKLSSLKFHEMLHAFDLTSKIRKVFIVYFYWIETRLGVWHHCPPVYLSVCQQWHTRPTKYLEIQCLNKLPGE